MWPHTVQVNAIFVLPKDNPELCLGSLSLRLMAKNWITPSTMTTSAVVIFEKTIGGKLTCLFSDACPSGYRLTFGYFNFGDFKSSGVFFNLASTSACSVMCDESSNCQSFLFRNSTGWCELLHDVITEATVEKQYSDYIICAAGRQI